MALLGITVPCLLAVAAFLALASGAASQGPAPAPASSVDCSSAVMGLSGCLSYVTKGSTQAKPTAECCVGVKAALKSPVSIACLCAAFTQNNAIPIDVARAATLPAACGGDPAAFSKCNIKVPGTPTEGPAPSSGSAPAANSPGSSKSAAARSPVSSFAVVAAVAAPLLSYYYL